MSVECSVLYEQETPRIFATPVALYKMRYYIDNTDKEIGWLGYVTKLSDTQYLIEDVFLLKQKVHSATTEIDAEALAKLATDLIKQGEKGMALYNKIRMWGHSHVNMSTGASGQDDNQMNEFATSDFYIRLIGNKRGEWNVCLYDYVDNLLWSGLELELYYDVEVTPEELDKEIKDNVSEFTYTNTTTTPLAGRGYKRDWWRDYERYDDYDDFGYGYGYGYSSKSERQADRLREEKETEEEEEETPYEIEDFPTKEDFRNMKRYYSSDEDMCLFMATAGEDDVSNSIFEDYGVRLTKEQVKDFIDEMLMIWTNKYSNKYIDKQGEV